MGKSNKNRKINSNSNEIRVDSDGEMAASLKCILDKITEQSASSSKQFEYLIGKLEELVRRNSSLQVEIDKLIRKTKELEIKVHVITNEMNDVYQERINNNIVLKGIPEVNNTQKLNAVVKDILQRVSLHLCDDLQDKILSIRRIGTVVPNKTRPVIVRLISNSIKRDIIRAKRSYELNACMFTVDSVPLGSNTQRIFIDEHLTKFNFALYMQSRALRKFGAKYVWTRNGCTFIKTTDNTKAMRIKNFEDLHVLEKELVKQMNI